jgi:ribosome-associated protein
MAKKTKKEKRNLIDVVIEAADEKKAYDFTIIDLSNINGRICDYFVICSATSSIQVESIVNNIELKVKKELKQLPYSIEGLKNAYWVILDYIDIVVHVMQQQAREYYELEKLWADTEIKKFNVIQ